MVRRVLLAFALLACACHRGGTDPGPPPRDLAAAAAEVTRLTGAAARPLQGADAPGAAKPTGGFAFDIPEAQARALLDRQHARFRAGGFFLFLHEHRFGLGGKPDEIGLLPTADPYVVLAAMGTNGDNYGHGTAEVIAWLRALEKDQPFEITGVGLDFVEGRFTAALRDPVALAKRIYAFCPDSVEQGAGTVDALAEDLAKERLFFFWWD